jgi:hypothetical protein
MNKEELLDLLKHLILQLRDHSKELQSDPRLMKDWVAKSKHLQNSLGLLNSCDALWVSENYGKWHKQEIQPYISKLDPALLKKLA